MICPHPMSIPRPNGRGASDRINIPCGKCAACLSSRREEWTIRLVEESKCHESTIFLTLTYSNENLRYGSSEQPILCKEDVQLFLKRLRERLSPKKIRYYCVGEYGTRTFRPHYHIALFNVSNDDYRHIDESWALGNIHIGELNVRSIAYSAKYHVNKGHYPSGASPPFTLMSTKPGIGFNYVKRMSKFHSGKIDKSFYPDYDKKKRLPRYFKNKLYTEIERQQMAQIFTDSTYDFKTIMEYVKSHPNSNYFKFKLDQVKNFESKFKEKSNFNNKL